MPPEFIKNFKLIKKFDIEKFDIFSLGLTLLRAITLLDVKIIQKMNRKQGDLLIAA